jgi:hypothetical protein
MLLSLKKDYPFKGLLSSGALKIGNLMLFSLNGQGCDMGTRNRDINFPHIPILPNKALYAGLLGRFLGGVLGSLKNGASGANEGKRQWC